jgi:hypothetical protein
MSYRLFTYPINELIVAPDAVAEALNQACQRHPGLRLTGVCQSHDHVCFPTEEAPAGTPAVRYVLAPVHADTTDDLAAELRQRWVSHFTTLGLIYLPNTYLGLFAHPAKS